jgi:hypothetical protein
MVTENSGQAAPSERPEILAMDQRLDPVRLQNAENVFRIWHVTVPIGTPVERVLVPEFWSRCAQKFISPAIDQPPDWIICRPPDRSWFVWLLVVSVGADGVEVARLAATELPHRRGFVGTHGPLGTNVEDFHFEDLGPGEGCQVVRTHDKHPMYKGRTRDECMRWLSSHLKTVRT